LRDYAKIVSIRRYLKTLTLMTEEEEGRVIKQQLERHIPGYKAKKDERGISRWLAALMLLVIVGSWMGWAWLAIHDHNTIVDLRQQIRDLTEAPANTIIRRNIAVIKRTDDWAFDAWVFDHAAHTWERFMFNVCPGPLKLTPDIRAGATITLWQYQEDTEHRCMDISNKTHAAIGVEMDGHGVPILASYAEPPTWRPDTPSE
jgi:hypothetical protein